MKKLLCLLAAMLLAALCAASAEDAATATDMQAAAPAAGYVRVIVGTEYRWFPLPAGEPYSITVKQVNPETGDEEFNIITFTSEGVYMSESTCENQDCVNMGMVTLLNKDERVLGNMVVCLPHQVMMELYTANELMAMLGMTGEEAQ